MDIGRMLVSIADSFETAAVTDAAERASKPEIPDSLSLTERVIAHMMRENTGASILDSGGAYGRNWQRNLVTPFWEEPRTTVEFRVREWSGTPELDYEITINLFHYLTERLDYDRAMTRQLRKFADLPDSPRYWSEIIEAFPEWIADKRKEKLREGPWRGNTCNEDNYLSSDVQYTTFTLGCEEYVILEIHGGCDIRGGYTEPKVFQVDDNCGSFGDWYRATIAPDHAQVKRIREAMLADLDRQPFLLSEVGSEIRAEVASLGDDVFWDVGGDDYNGEGCSLKLDQYPVRSIESVGEWTKGWICVMPDRSALCPETGVMMGAHFY